MIAVNILFGLMAGDIGNSFFTAPCTEKVCSTCGQQFGANFGDIVVLKRALYGLNTAYNLFHNFFGDFLIDIIFTPYMADQYLWLSKSDKYDGYDYIATHIDYIIIASKNPSKYMN